MGSQSFVQFWQDSRHLLFVIQRFIFLLKGKKMNNIHGKGVAYPRVYEFGRNATAILDRWRATFLEHKSLKVGRLCEGSRNGFSSCPGEDECHDSQRNVKMKLAILKVIWIRCNMPIKCSKGKVPPRMYRAVKPQIFCKMKRHVLIW